MWLLFYQQNLLINMREFLWEIFYLFIKVLANMGVEFRDLSDQNKKNDRKLFTILFNPLSQLFLNINLRSKYFLQKSTSNQALTKRFYIIAFSNRFLLIVQQIFPKSIPKLYFSINNDYTIQSYCSMYYPFLSHDLQTLKERQKGIDDFLLCKIFFLGGATPLRYLYLQI